MNIPYQAIIGLAGHVDHGKTTLIHALTGIMTARTHEQALGMTQDLGFAYFNDEKANLIGVIDVPGHERYLRNMVAGIWGVNVLLLVISAKEGCMPMTLTHTKIAKAMGVERIIIALNKCDLVSTDKITEIEESVLETIMDTCDVVPEIIAVSALTGHNLDKLKALLTDQVKISAKNKIINASPYLYVDRAFVAQGIGTIVTGTLAQGTLSIGDKLRCEPSGVIGSIRSIHCYNKQLDSVFATSRVALNIKGLSKNQVQRGSLLLPVSTTSKKSNVTLNTSFISTAQCIVRLAPIDKKGKHKANKQVELATGSWHGMAQLIPVPNTNLGRLLLPHPIPLRFGQPVMIIENGGKHLLFKAEVVWRETIAKFKKRAVYQMLTELPKTLSPSAQSTMLINLQGYFPKSLMHEVDTTQYDELGEHYVNKEWQEEQLHLLLHGLKQGQSLSSLELAHFAKLELPVVNALLQKLKTQKQIHLQYGKWHIGNGASEDELSIAAQKILALARNARTNGLELNKIDLGENKKWLKQLTHQKFLTSLTSDIYFDMQTYLELVQAIIQHKAPKDTTSIQEMKEITGLSRKYIIPLANRMEKDGWMRRHGEIRIIMKKWC